MDYSPWGCKESDTTEQVSTSSVLMIQKQHFIGIPQAQLFRNGQNPQDSFDRVRK